MFKIFFPVWIDECAPAKNQTMWMSMFFITEHMGIVIGYGLSYFMGLSWPFGFVVQAVMMALTGVLFLTVPKLYFEESSNLVMVTVKPVEAEAITNSSPAIEPPLQKR